MVWTKVWYIEMNRRLTSKAHSWAKLKCRLSWEWLHKCHCFHIVNGWMRKWDIGNWTQDRDWTQDRAYTLIQTRMLKSLQKSSWLPHDRNLCQLWYIFLSISCIGACQTLLMPLEFHFFLSCTEWCFNHYNNINKHTFHLLIVWIGFIYKARLMDWVKIYYE